MSISIDTQINSNYKVNLQKRGIKFPCYKRCQKSWDCPYERNILHFKEISYISYIKTTNAPFSQSVFSSKTPVPPTCVECHIKGVPSVAVVFVKCQNLPLPFVLDWMSYIIIQKIRLCTTWSMKQIVSLTYHSFQFFSLLSTFYCKCVMKVFAQMHTQTALKSKPSAYITLPKSV